jgi:hypothetical protein
MFVEETQGRRINHLRSEEAQSTGAAIVGTNCPFCVQMFDDGLAAVEPDEGKRAKAMDLAELLELTVPAPDRGRSANHRATEPGSRLGALARGCRGFGRRAGGIRFVISSFSSRMNFRK